MIKPSASLRAIGPQMGIADTRVFHAYMHHGADCIIVSGDDRPEGYSGRSKHPLGEAIDYRTWHVDWDVAVSIAKLVARRLGCRFRREDDKDVVFTGEHYDVVLHKDVYNNAGERVQRQGLHVEYDEKKHKKPVTRSA